jgi:hypothetical protein
MIAGIVLTEFSTPFLSGRTILKVCGLETFSEA